MQRKILLGVAAFVYYALVSVALFFFESDLIVTALALYGLPAYLLARYSAAPSAVLVSVTIFGTGIAILLEGIAHIYGIWYTLGVDELRLFNLISIEVLFCTVMQTLFLALLYEFIFDDGQYTASSARVRLAAFGAFTLSVLLLVGVHQYLVDAIFFSHSYIWIVGILVASSLAALAVHRSLTLRFFDRLSAFCIVGSVPLLLSVFFAVVNTHKVFAHVGDYLFSFSLWGNVVPIEEVILVFVLPLFVATFYELYLDDGR